ncbi:MAG: hypothetical protein IT361_01595 [Gemmatimonadaceae bacterium]|nr:hypothetical protein [Gemmatimonadaceae bacterium]
MRNLLGALGIAATAGTASVAESQQRDTVARRDSAAADTTRPFVRGGVYDKPFQTRLLGRTAIGGYAEVHARYQRVNGVSEASGFDARRFNLFTNTRVSDVVTMAAELEIEDGGREITLEYAAIDLRVHPALAIRGGMLLSPIGRFNLTHDSPLNEFTDRPLVSTEVLGVALSEPGIGVYGRARTGRRGRVTWELYATNGFHEGLLADAGTRIPLGKANTEDNNGSPAVVGRIAWSPGVAHEVGVSTHRGAWNGFLADGARIDEQRDVQLTVLDAETALWGVELRGELAMARVDVPNDLRGIYAERQRGVYAEATRAFGRGWIRTLPTSTFLLKARADHVDFDRQRPGDSVAQWTVGVNFRPTTDSVIKFDYVRGRSRDRFNNASDHAYLLASLATYF